MKYLDEKYHDDIVMKKENLNKLDGIIMENDKKVQASNAIIVDKDRWIEAEKLKLTNLEKQLLALKYYKEEQEKVIIPHRQKLDSLQDTVIEVSI